jgi:choline dehydrogenase-like flavoprotein
MRTVRAEVAIIGSGPGGATLFHALARAGTDVLLIERGDYLPQEEQNWDVGAVFDQKRYSAGDVWEDDRGRPFRPGTYAFVGGSSKMWGACLTRFRAEDFHELRHHGGSSPAWPFDYAALAPYYDEAEQLYGVHGAVIGDPTAPDAPPPPYPPITHEPTMQRFVDSFRAQGLHPYTLPLGIDLHDGGACVRCKTCDGFPCRVLAKNDADVRCVRPGLKASNANALLRTRVDRLLTNGDGDTVIAAEAVRGPEQVRIEADRFVIACGAANSAALLLRSGGPAHPAGLANSSDQVGRNYMQHQFTALMAIHPVHKTNLVYQKTIGLNDFYLPGDDRVYPLGNIQALGKLQAGMLTADMPWAPRPLMRYLSERSADWWTTTEDLPSPDNRVTLSDGGRIRLTYRPNNVRAQRELTAIAKRILRRAGYPVVIAKRMPLATTSAQCGTARMGADPRSSVVDPLCRSHDVANLYVVDGSVLPCSTALNPGLTIAAIALRVAALSDLADGRHAAAAHA